MANAKQKPQKTVADPIYSPKELFELGITMAKANLPMLVVGKPGQGKSDIIASVAVALKADLFISHPVVDEPIDYKGMPSIYRDDGGKMRAEFLPYGQLMNLIEATGPTIHFADDLGQAPDAVKAAYMQLLLNRAINGHKVADSVVFFAASNRKEDKASVRSFLEPLKDRFVTIAQLENSMKDWCEWMLIQAQNKLVSEDTALKLVSYIRYRPEVLDEFEPTSDFSRTPTPRSIWGIARMMEAGMPKHLQLRAFSGAIGKHRGTELTSFLRIWETLPDPDQILTDPKKAMIPDDAGTKWALCGALAARASKNNIERIIEYADRLPTEFSVLLVKDSITKDNSLCKNKAFTKWAVDKQDVLT